MNETQLIDMHVHSTASDGTCSPSELIAEAKRAGLSAMALTDHDTMDGIPEALRAADSAQLELIPGIEFSTDHMGLEVHVLGYYLSPEYPELKKHMKAFREFRTTRNDQMASKLREEGFSITMEDLNKAYPGSVITRAHFARYLFDTKQISDIRIAFDKYIGDHCRCYVPRPKISPVDTVKLIRRAGGLAVLAHPVMYKLSKEQLTEMLFELKEVGLCGLEAIYSENTKEDERYYLRLAKDLGLLVSGGSDYHGANKPAIRLGVGKGNLHIPYSILQAFKELRP